MPHTTTLHLRSYTNLNQSLDQVTIHHITSHLPQFTSLAYLALDRPDGFSSNFDENQAQVTVTTWGDVCPTLMACCLNGFAWKKVHSAWQGCSIREFRVLAGRPVTVCL
ncbi:hypothetical protein B0H19DRAFT_715401 [Mycena capillaripes]|nr:hypothetical protein B0H19DRAFT_715401 [Mycena capillaripes]